MTFVIQPTEEGETRKCPACDVELIARWNDYNGKYEDKLQWQTVEPRKAHYDKNGNCKGAEDVKSTLADTTPTREDIPSKANSIDEDMRYVKNKIDLMFAMISEQFRDYTDRKNHS